MRPVVRRPRPGHVGQRTVRRHADDPNGNVTSHTDNLAVKATDSTFDAENRLSSKYIHSTSYTPISYETLSYDAVGNVTDDVLHLYGVSGSIRSTHSVYDGAGNVIEQETSYSGGMATTYYGYDSDSRLTMLVDPDLNTTMYSYDAAGNQTMMIDPTGHTAYYQYNDDNELIKTVDRDGRTISDSYDSEGNKTAEVWYDSSHSVVESFAYGFDGDGNMTSASVSDGTDTYAYALSYDALGRVTSVSEPFGVTLAMGYDGRGNRTSLVDSLGGSESSQFDTADELVARTLTQSGDTLSFTQQFDEFGRVDFEADSYNGTEVVERSYAYNSDGLPSDIDETTPSAGLNFSLEYDGADELIDEDAGGLGDTQYTYDSSGQLVSGVTSGGPSTSYGYDAAGNDTDNLGVTTGNEIDTDGTWSYTYDNEGNVIGKTDSADSITWTYTYDNRNQLTQAVEDSEAGPYTATYVYGPLGELLSQGPLESGQTLDYVYDAWNPAKAGAQGNAGFDVLADLDAGAGNTLVTRYLHGDQVNQLIGRYDANPQPGAGTNAKWILTDERGSVRGVADATGDVEVEMQYDAFGNSDYAPSTTADDPADFLGRYRWAGQSYDDHTQLQYNNARWYNPSTGTWMSQDPLGFSAGDSNLYRYVNNAPTDATDPSGLSFMMGPPQANYKYEFGTEQVDADTTNIWFAKVYKLPFEKPKEGFIGVIHSENPKSPYIKNGNFIIPLARFDEFVKKAVPTDLWLEDSFWTRWASGSARFYEDTSKGYWQGLNDDDAWNDTLVRSIPPRGGIVPFFWSASASAPSLPTALTPRTPVVVGARPGGSYSFSVSAPPGGSYSMDVGMRPTFAPTQARPTIISVSPIPTPIRIGSPPILPLDRVNRGAGLAHESAIDRLIDGLPGEAINTRRNQAQVDVNENLVGLDVHPDLQTTIAGQRNYFQIISEHSPARLEELAGNDPLGVFRIFDLRTNTVRKVGPFFYTIQSNP
jgi:RHS repeat-associated protein